MNRTDLLALATMVAYPEATIVVTSYTPERHDMIHTQARPKNPETHTDGLGEIIRAHRFFIGLSQRDMADRLGKDRRDYQRIENGKDRCPPGLLSQLEELSDLFDYQVEKIVEAAYKAGGLTVEVRTDGEPGSVWERLVAGRAAVVASEDAPVRLTIVGKVNHERSAQDDRAQHHR